MWKCLTPTLSSTSLMEEHWWQTAQLNHSELMLDIWHQCTVGKCQHVYEEHCGLSVVWSLRSKVSSWFLSNYSVRFWHVIMMAVAAVSSQSCRAKAFHITTEGQNPSFIRQEHTCTSGAVWLYDRILMVFTFYSHYAIKPRSGICSSV